MAAHARSSMLYQHFLYSGSRGKAVFTVDTLVAVNETFPIDIRIVLTF